MSRYRWTPVGTSWWQHELPDGRRLDVRFLDEKRWLWTVTSLPRCAELTGWSKTFDAAKLRCLLAWKDTATAEHWRWLNTDAINHLTREAS